MRTPFALSMLVFVLLLSSGGFASGQDKDSQGKKEKATPEWESLDEEQQEKLRRALREVWTDPGVVSAREEVRVATEAYQRAIRTAVGKSDPSVGEVLKRLQTINEGRSRERIGGGPPGRIMARRGGDYPMGPPGFMESLSEEERNRFKEAEAQARDSEAVKAASLALEELREEDEALRRKRMEIHRRIRVAMLSEMVRIDPSLKPIREKLLRQGPGGKGGPKAGAPAPAPPEGRPKKKD